MIHLIIGGSGSGKSEYAEAQVLHLSDPENRYYLATMQAFGEEGRRRVERHRKLREGKHFQTVECPLQIQKALTEISAPAKACILIECISNLVANEMFSTEEGEQQLTERVVKQVREICEHVQHAVIVTNDIFGDGEAYDEETMRYMDYLARVNRKLAEAADQVTEVVAGIPLERKRLCD